MMKSKTFGMGLIMADLKVMARAYDLTKAGLGHDLIEINTDYMHAQMDAECDPDGMPWASLSPIYAEWKAIEAPGQPIGVLYGHMKTIDQLRGEVVVTPGYAEQIYGTEQKTKIEATKFQEGGRVTGTGQPPRPFYGLCAAGIDAIDDFLKTILQYLIVP